MRVLRREFRRLSLKFLRIELAIAWGSCEVANREPAGTAKRLRNTRAARDAYEAILHVLQKVPLMPLARQAIDRQLGQLQRTLKLLGEDV